MMRKKRILLPVVLCALAVVSVALLVSCVDNTVPQPNTPSDNNKPAELPEGFSEGAATVENMSAELIGGINSALRPVTNKHLGANNPKASAFTEWQLSVNGRAAVLKLSVDYDYDKYIAEDADATRMAATLQYEGESAPELEVYFYSDDNYIEHTASDGTVSARSGGKLYFSLADADIFIPLYNSALTNMLPMNEVNGTLISQVLAASLNFSDLKYFYRNDEGSKRTNRYSVTIDLRKTLSNLLAYFDKSSDLESYLKPVEELITALFGVDPGRLESEMPATKLEVAFETTGALRTGAGSGRLSDISIELDVAASDKTDTLFGGKAYNIKAEMLNCEVKSALISDEEKLPSSNNRRFDSYYVYDERAMHVDGKIRYFDTASHVFEAGKYYDISLSFQYRGLEDNDPDSSVSIEISDPDDPTYVPFKLEYRSGEFSIVAREKSEGKIVTHTFKGVGHFKTFLKGVIGSFEAKHSMSVIEAVSFILEHIRVSHTENSTLVSLICNEDFFLEALGFGDKKENSAHDALDEFINYLHLGFVQADGTGTFQDALKNAGIDFGKYIIETECELSLDISGNFFELTDEFAPSRE